jgi:hypothetical protein
LRGIGNARPRELEISFGAAGRLFGFLATAPGYAPLFLGRFQFAFRPGQPDAR